MSERTLLMVYPEPVRQWGGERLRKLAIGLPPHGWRVHLLAAPRSSYRRLRSQRAHDEWSSSEGMVHRAPDLNPFVAGSWVRRRLAGRRQDHPSPQGLGLTGQRPARGFVARQVLTALNRLWYPDFYAGWVPFAIAEGLAVVARQHAAAVMSSYPPASSHLVGLSLHAMTGIPWISDFRDPWARAAEHGYPCSSRWLDRTLEALVCTRSSAVVAVNRAIADEIAGDYRVDVTTLPQGVVRSTTGCRRTHERRERLWVVHAGTASRWGCDLVPTLRVMLKLFANGAAIGLRLVGEVHEIPPELRKGVDVGLVDVVGVVSQERARRYVREGDVALLLRTLPGALWVTTKLWDYLGEERPILVLADPASDCARIVETTHAGWVVPYWDEAQIERTVVEIYGRWQAGELAWSGDSERLAPYDASSIAGRFAVLLDGIVAKHETPR